MVILTLYDAVAWSQTLDKPLAKSTTIMLVVIMLTCYSVNELTHWGRVTHICVSKLTIIGSNNGLSPGRRQAIIWTNAGILLIGPSGTNFNEILIEILTFSFKKMRLKVSSAKRRPFCLGLNELITCRIVLILRWAHLNVHDAWLMILKQYWMKFIDRSNCLPVKLIWFLECTCIMKRQPYYF